MQIILHNLPKISTNTIYQGVHYRVRKSHKDQYLLLTKQIFKKIPAIDYKVDLEFTFYFKSHALDSSNCSYCGKILEDCLVKYGVLKNDNIKYVGKVSYQSLKGDSDKCVINIKQSE